MKIEDVAKRLCKGRASCLEPACVELCGDCQDIIDSCLDGIREGLKIAILIAEQRGGAYHFVDKVNDVLDGKREIPEEVSGGE